MKKTNKFTLVSILLLAVGLLLSNINRQQEPFTKVAEEIIPKTVMIQVVATVRVFTIEDLTALLEGIPPPPPTYKDMLLLGSGVLISPNGHVLTCAHLFTHGKVKSISVKLFNEYEYAGDKLAIDVQKDLALVKIYEKTPDYARLADPRSLKVGQEVLAVGNPLGLEFSLTHGILSYLNRDLKGSYNSTQSDTFINPGNSGGPLFNLKGELVGINSFMVPVVDAAIFTGCGFSVQPGQIIEFITSVNRKVDGLPHYKHSYWLNLW